MKPSGVCGDREIQYLEAPRVQILKGEVFERMGRVRNSVSQGSWEVNTDFGVCGAFGIHFGIIGTRLERCFICIHLLRFIFTWRVPYSIGALLCTYWHQLL